MNKLMTATAAAALLAISASASSAEDSANIKITANEPVVCGFFPPSGTPGPGVATGDFDIVSDVNNLQNIELKGPASGFTPELQVQFKARCNTEFTLQAKTDESGKLVNKDAPAGTTLVTELPYSFRIRVVNGNEKDTFDPAPSSLTEATSISSLTDINALLNITIFPKPVSGDLYAGDFVDTIRLEIGAKMAPSS
jgi:hypothetical protein